METQTNQNNIAGRDAAAQSAAAVSPVTEIRHESTLFAEPIGSIGSFPITNSLLTSVATVIIIVAFAAALRGHLREIPKGIQNVFEAVLEEALALCDQVTGSREITTKVFPLAFSIFTFILVNNWVGLLPLGGFGVIEKSAAGLSFVPFLRSGSADLNTTLALAVMAVIGANIFGIFSVGIWKLFNKYINLKAIGGIFAKVRHEPSVIVVAPVEFFVGILELIGEFAKVASLSFRLFGNVFAGEVLLAAMGAILSYALPIPFMFLEIFVGVIQALIFAILLLVYFTIAAEDHGSESHETAAAH